ncbi:MAG: glycosyltransferase family 2 protein [Nitrospira sp.]|nr:glycosyltransferase family 2 protein [Nitrospira sp.]
MPQVESLLTSVVLCTYNRCDLMAAALRSLCEQTLAPTSYEVIVVDNNSTDGTRQHVADIGRQHPHVRYCFEAQQGLSHSRNTGFQAARGLYVAYIDDDCTVPQEWLDIAHQVIVHVAPAIFGGPYRPFYQSLKPKWYLDRYGTYDDGPISRVLDEDDYLSGTNLFIRRSLLEQLGGFNTAVGMAGTRLGYGEETSLQRRVRQERPDEMIYYEPRLAVSHLVRPEKMRLIWCAKQMFVSGRDWQRVVYDTATERIHTILSCLRALRALLELTRSVILGLLGRDRIRYPYIENYLYEVVFVHLQTLGSTYEQITHRAEH